MNENDSEFDPRELGSEGFDKWWERNKEYEIERLYSALKIEHENAMQELEMVWRNTHGLHVKKVKPKYALVTINPREGTTVSRLLKIWNKIKNKKWVTNSYSCLEWRGIDKGLHLHMELEYLWRNPDKKERKKSKSEIQKECYSTCKTVVDNDLHCWIEVNEHGFKNYINGIKNDKIKITNEVTLDMRKKYKIFDILEDMIN